MDSYEDCPKCGRLVQRGRICRYCAQTADPPDRRLAPTSVPVVTPRGHAEPAPPTRPKSDRTLTPLPRWAWIALVTVVVCAIIAAVVAWGTLGGGSPPEGLR